MPLSRSPVAENRGQQAEPNRDAVAAAPGGPREPRQDVLRGIGFVLMSMLLFSFTDAAAKVLTRTLPAIEIAWLRYVAFFAIMAAVAARAGPSAWRARRPLLQVGRGLGMLAAAVFFVVGLGHLPMAEATAISFMSPLLLTALSIPLLQEKVGVRRWTAVAVGLVGMLIIVRPGTASFEPAALFPLLSSFGWAFALIFTRMTRGADGVLVALLYSALVGFALLTLMVPFVWVTPSLTDLALGAVIGIVSTVAQWFIVIGYRSADASLLAPLSYGQLILSSLFGYVLFGNIPDGWTILGAAVIILSGLYTARRERAQTAA